MPVTKTTGFAFLLKIGRFAIIDPYATDGGFVQFRPRLSGFGQPLQH
jgi:hypothetical protein